MKIYNLALVYILCHVLIMVNNVKVNANPIVIDGSIGFSATDTQGELFNFSTGSWVYIRNPSVRQFFRSTNGVYRFSGANRLLVGHGEMEQKDDYYKFMIIVLDAKKKIFNLLDTDGYYLKAYSSDYVYYVYAGFNNRDVFSDWQISDAPGGGFYLQNTALGGGYRVHDILDYCYVLAITPPNTKVDTWEHFEFIPTSAPANKWTYENTLENIVYDKPGHASMTPTIVGSVKCKTGPETDEVTLTQSKKTINTNSFSLTESFSVGSETSIKGKIPFINVDVNENITIHYSKTQHWNKSSTVEEFSQESVKITCPPYSDVVVTFTWQKGTVSVGYTADLKRIINRNGVPYVYLFKGITSVFRGVQGKEVDICKGNRCAKSDSSETELLRIF